MPYIEQEDRSRLLYTGDPGRSPGELNFIIFRACVQYCKENRLCYDSLNDVMGALSGVQQEFYRRVVVPYEDKKIHQNRDIPEIQELFDEA